MTAAVRMAHPRGGVIGASMVVLPLHDRVVGPAKSWLLLPLAAVGCVVLVGCVNAASLLLARASVRGRELATRAALGASRARLARGLLLEGVLLAAAASVAAVAVAFWGVGVAKAHLPANLARTGAIALDLRVLVASIAAALLCGLFAGGVPAWRVARSDLFGRMKLGGGVIGGRRQARSLGTFLTAEVAFATLLLVATTLAVTSFVLVSTADLGFDRRDAMAISVSKALRSLPEPERPAAAAAFFADILTRARAVPGVRAAGLVGGGGAPLSGDSIRYAVTVPGFGELRGEDMFETRAVSPEYFDAMGLRLLRGRLFDPSDRAGAPSVVIINDLAARRYFPGRDPIGAVITARERDARIVGVIHNVHLRGPEADLHTEMYFPLAQENTFTFANGELVVRYAGSAPALARAVQEAIAPALSEPVPEPRFIDEAFRRLTAERRFNAGLLSAFGLLAVIIGAIGVYGTMAFAVAQQARAIGLRMALGASQTRVVRSILRDALRWVAAGAALGLIGAWLAAELFTSLVFGVRTTNPVVYVGVGAGLTTVGVLAALVPARRAARIDPVEALRGE